jgi:hypothetical protein
VLPIGEYDDGKIFFKGNAFMCPNDYKVNHP